MIIALVLQDYKDFIEEWRVKLEGIESTLSKDSSGISIHLFKIFNTFKVKFLIYLYFIDILIMHHLIFSKYF